MHHVPIPVPILVQIMLGTILVSQVRKRIPIVVGSARIADLRQWIGTLIVSGVWNTNILWASCVRALTSARKIKTFLSVTRDTRSCGPVTSEFHPLSALNRDET